MTKGINKRLLENMPLYLSMKGRGNFTTLGKHEGKKISELPLSYLFWLVKAASGRLRERVKREIFKRHREEFGVMPGMRSKKSKIEKEKNYGQGKK